MGKVDGADRLERRLRRIPVEARRAMRAAVEVSAADVVGTQRRLAPKKTGKLAASIVYTMGSQNLPAYATLRSAGNGQGDPNLTAIVTAGNSGVRTAHIVEFGSAPHVQGGIFEGASPAVMHPGTEPQPFFYPGYRLRKKAAKSRIARAVKKAAKAAASS